MAKTVTVELQAKTDKAIGEIESLKKEIEKLQEEVAKGNKQTKEGLDSVGQASNKTAKGVTAIGNAIKAAGIGIAIALFAKLTEVFNQNQKVLNTFNTVFEALSIAFNDFFNFLDSNIGTVTGYFKDLFENPVENLKAFGQAIVDNVIERFNSALDVLGYLSEAVVKVFQGDFKGALDSVKEAGKETVDVITGVDDSFDKTVETVSNVTKAVADYTKATIEPATATVELNRTAEVSRVINQGLIEDYDRQAEAQRQIRDDERNTIEERIEANNKLAEILEMQQEKMLENADSIIAAAQAQYDKNKNDENYIALLEAQNEKQAILAQIEGFRSEQKANDLALDRESIELQQSITDAESERAIANAEFNAEMIDNETARLIMQRKNLDEEIKNETDRLKAKKANFKEGTQAYIDADNELKLYEQESANRTKKLDKEIAESKVAAVSGALGSLATLVGENSKFGKAIAITQAIIDTYAGANKALAQGGIFGFIGAASVIAAGFANIRNITSTKEPSPPSFAKAGPAVAQPTAPASTPPAFNVVGATAESQLAQTIAGAQQKPVRAYVVSTDISSQQALDRKTANQAAIGN